MENNLSWVTSKITLRSTVFNLFKKECITKDNIISYAKQCIESIIPYEEEFILKKGQQGIWKQLKKSSVPESWSIKYGSYSFELKLSSYKHLGLFPEQRTNWDFIKKHLKNGDSFLNLFGYTGASSCVARYIGADTIHVDASKPALSSARSNMELNRIMNIRWVLEDAAKFLGKEVQRGHHYKGIQMDPPAWGNGAKGEKWKLEDQLDELLSNAEKALAPDGFLIMNTYSPTVDFESISQLSELYFPDREKEVAELVMITTTGKHLYFGNLLRVKPKLISEEETY